MIDLPANTSPFKTKSQRSEEREAKRDALIRTAVQMFNDRGFHSTSLDDVASMLGVSKPTVYHYLGNKEQVLLECVARGIDELRAAATESADAPGSGKDRLRAFLIRYARINMDDFGRCVIRTADEGLSPEGALKFRGLKKEIDKAMRDLITDAMQDGSIASGDVRLTAFTLAGSLNWVARWFVKDGPECAEDVSRRMVDLLISGIAKGVAPSSADDTATATTRRMAINA